MQLHYWMSCMVLGWHYRKLLYILVSDVKVCEAQVQYQLSGRDLGGSNNSGDPQLRQRVTTAFQRTLGPGVNATLMDLRQAPQTGALMWTFLAKHFLGCGRGLPC